MDGQNRIAPPGPDGAEGSGDEITVFGGGRVGARDTPDALIASASARLGRQASLWDVFMAYTGRSLDDDIAEDGEEATS